MRASFKITIVAAALGLGTACAPPPPGAPPNYYATSGALLGAMAGAAIGHDIDPTGGAATGALAGALIGGAIGNDMDWQSQGYYYDERPYPAYDEDDGYAPPPPRRYYGPAPRYRAPPSYGGGQPPY